MGGVGSGPYHASAVGTEAFERNQRNVILHRKLWKMRDIDLSDAEAVEGRFLEYVDLCGECGVEPNPSGLALALNNTSSGVLTRIVRGQIQPVLWSKESVDMVRRCYGYLEATAESALLNPDNKNAAQRIFQLKNRYGWVDTREEVKLEMKRELPSANQKQMEALAKKYLAQAGVVEVDAEVGEA